MLPRKRCDRDIGKIYKYKDRDVYWNGKSLLCQAHDKLTKACVDCNFEKRTKSYLMDPETGTKKCARCEEIHAAEDFCLNSNSPDGLCINCRDCVSEQKRRQRNTLKSRSEQSICAIQKSLYPNGSKTCSSCKKSHPFKKFYKSAGFKDGLQPICISCNTLKNDREHAKSKDVREQAKEGKLCAMCGNCDTRTFEFAHVDPSAKARRTRGKRKNTAIQPAQLTSGQIVKELPNVKILCAVCHRVETAKAAGDTKAGDSKGLSSNYKDKRKAAADIFSKREKLRIGKCAHCQVSVEGRYFREFDFDHKPMYTKTHSISNMVADGYSIKAIEAEIAKTELLCANCHRIKTGLRKETGEVLGDMLDKIEDIFATKLASLGSLGALGALASPGSPTSPASPASPASLDTTEKSSELCFINMEQVQS